jgi:uncharacterized protein (DUF427 family)
MTMTEKRPTGRGKLTKSPGHSRARCQEKLCAARDGAEGRPRVLMSSPDEVLAAHYKANPHVAAQLKTSNRRLANVTSAVTNSERSPTVASGVAPSAGLLPTPVAHWPLDAVADGPSPTGRPRALDVAGGHHGVVVGATVAKGARILRRGALKFTAGAGDHVFVPHSPDFELSSFSVCAWVRLMERTLPTGPADVLGGVLGTRFGTHPNCFDLKINGGGIPDGPKVHGDIGDGETWIENNVNVYADETGSNDQGGELQQNRWYHLTWVVDSVNRETRMYINGDKKKALAFPSGAPTPMLMTEGGELHIGQSSPTEFMDGLIADVRIYGEALDDRQARAVPAVREPAPVMYPRQGPSQEVDLFNGENLDGWDFTDKFWTVRDGAIVGKSWEPVVTSTYCLTKQHYTDFRLICKVKLQESEMHSGIAFWGHVPPPQHGESHCYAGHLVMFPSNWSIYDLNPDPVNPGEHMIVEDPPQGRQMIFPDPGIGKYVGGGSSFGGSSADHWKLGKNGQHDWNELEILAQGNRIRVVCNGTLIVDWRDPEPFRIRSGPIGLQLHSNDFPQEVQFKGLKLEAFPQDIDGLKTLTPVIPPMIGMSERILPFNGKDLDGWDFTDKFWSVQDGIIVGKSTEPVLTSTYCLTKRHYTDFRLTIDVKLVESEMHSGISLWGHVPPPQHGESNCYAGHLVMFPSGWGMYDLNPDPVNAGAHMIVEDPPQGRQMIYNNFEVASQAGYQHGWNRLEILAQGNRLRVVCNGTQIVEWRDREPFRIKSGPIGLQLHSNDVPQEVHFANMEIETFPEDVLKTLNVPMVPQGIPDQPEIPSPDDATRNVANHVAPVVAPLQGVSETIRPFNGHSLDGWDFTPKFWSIDGDEIVAKSTDPVITSTYCLTEQHFTDFRMTLKVKLVESEVHSGIAFWGEVPPPHHGDDEHTYSGHLVMFPSGWGMFDLHPDPVNAGGHIGRSMIFADPITPDAPEGIAKKVGKQHDWNELEILAQGNRIRVVCNGTLIVDWRDPEPHHILPGPIGLQCHSNPDPQEIRFKDIVIETFPPEADVLKTLTAPITLPLGLRPSSAVPLFNGRNFDGWHGSMQYWSIDGSDIVAATEQPLGVSTYLLTDKDYSDFRLTCSAKLCLSEMHSGITLWGRQAPEQGEPNSYAGHLVMFPSNWGMFDLYGRNMIFDDPGIAKIVGHQHDWNELEILAQGNRIRVVCNGTLIVDWRDPEPHRVRAGPIGLQCHSNPEPQEIRWKSLMIEEFPDSDELLTLRVPPIQRPLSGRSERIQLFNGKDLDGWDFTDKFWSVQDGIIVGKSTEPVLTSTYCLTKRHYTDFRLLCYVKLVESEMHSGISLWGEVPPPQHGESHTYAGHLVMFPSNWSLFDLLPDPVNAGGHIGRSMIFHDPGVAKRVGHQHDWNELEILAQGNRLQVVCNGTLIVDYVDPEPHRIKAAPIGLQLHSNSVPQEVHFAGLELETFPTGGLMTMVDRG